MGDQGYIEALNHTQGIVVKYIAKLEAGCTYFEAVAMTAIDENAELREALKVRREEACRKHVYQLELEAEVAALREALQEIADSDHLGNSWARDKAKAALVEGA